MNQLTQEEITNLLALIKRANITGAEALPVAMLQQKLSALLTPTTEKPAKK
jgi:hypothetical protein